MVNGHNDCTYIKLMGSVLGQKEAQMPCDRVVHIGRLELAAMICGSMETKEQLPSVRSNTA